VVKSKSIVKSKVSNQPFDEVKVVAFSFSPKNREEIAFLQYNLLLKPEILQAHLDTQTHKGKLICITAFDAEKALGEAGLKVKLRSVEWILYKEYCERNTSCSVDY
jgi:hypothetical protein